MKARSLLVTDVNQIELGEIEIPDPGPNEVLIRSAYSCISPGTELRALAGKQQGSTNRPYIPGYAVSGVVAAAGRDTHFKEGQPVYSAGTQRASANRLWGGHCEYAVRSAAAVFPLPEGLNLKTASIAKLAAISYHGSQLSKAQPEDRVAIIGLGPIGQLSARLHQLSGARVVACDLSQERVAIAKGADVEAICPAGQSLAEAFVSIFPDGASVVVDSTGAPAVLKQAVLLGFQKPWESAAPGPRLLIQGSYPEDFCIPYQESFCREYTVLIPRDQTPQDLIDTLDLMAQGSLQVDDLLGEPHSPANAQAVYDKLLAGKSTPLTGVFDWS